MNHYEYLEKHLPTFWQAIGVDTHGWFTANSMLSAHGDKAYGYRDKWAKAGIPFAHGVALYLLSYIKPYSDQTRQTTNGWVDVSDWVIANYPKFRDHLPPVWVTSPKVLYALSIRLENNKVIRDYFSNNENAIAALNLTKDHRRDLKDLCSNNRISGAKQVFVYSFEFESYNFFVIASTRGTSYQIYYEDGIHEFMANETVGEICKRFLLHVLGDIYKE